MRFWTWILVQAFSGLLLVPDAAYSQTITDGDTLKLDGVTYRLWESTRQKPSRTARTAGRPDASRPPTSNP